MLNKIILKGNIGRSPHFTTTQDNKEVGKFFLATTMSWKSEDGEWQSHTDWHRITVFKPSTLKWMKDVLKRGDMIYVEGKLSYHCWVDKYDQNRVTPHVMVTNRDGVIELIRSAPLASQKTTSEPTDEQDIPASIEKDAPLPNVVSSLEISL